jgi:hypothetical protein
MLRTLPTLKYLSRVPYRDSRLQTYAVLFRNLALYSRRCRRCEVSLEVQDCIPR